MRIFNVENVLGEMYIDKATFPHLKSQNNMHQFNPHLTQKSIGPVQIKAPDGVHWSVPNSLIPCFSNAHELQDFRDWPPRQNSSAHPAHSLEKIHLKISQNKSRERQIRHLKRKEFRRNSCFFKVE